MGVWVVIALTILALAKLDLSWDETLWLLILTGLALAFLGRDNNNNRRTR